MFLLLTAALIVPAPAQAAVQGELEAPHEVIVEIAGAEARSDFRRILAEEGLAVVREVPALDLLLVALPPERSLAGAVEELARLPGVGFAEPNGMGEGGDIVVPHDTFFGEQWPHRNTGQWGGLPGADIESVHGWELTRGSASVLVAVLDSGLTTGHPEFVGRVVPGYDFIDHDPNTNDPHGHGTMVTGILAAHANGFGIAGVDHSCTILPIKVLNRNNGGSLMSLVEALVFAADAGADVVNMSLINYPASNALNNALVYARNAGCVLVACAGNGGVGNADQSLPGRSPIVISVGATTMWDERAWYSGTGSELDVVAPSDGAPATDRSFEDTWLYFGGCSGATPVVSGIVALALSIDPTLTHDEIAALLAAGAEDQVGPAFEDTPGRDDNFGHGRVNLLRTLCGLDQGAPLISGPDLVRVEGSKPLGLAADDPAVVAALAAIAASDDLDPDPTLTHPSPGFLVLGKTVALPFTARDACGNQITRTIGIRVEDTLPPLVAAEIERRELDPRDGGLVPVGLQVAISDGCDAAPEKDVRVFCDEPAPRGDRDAYLDRSRALHLRAERDGAGDGRVYLVLVRATDDSGNSAFDCASAVVPRDPGSLDAVLAAAAAAEAHALATGGPPPGYSELAVSVLSARSGSARPTAR